jgi:hypothetical protein
MTEMEAKEEPKLIPRTLGWAESDIVLQKREGWGREKGRKGGKWLARQSEISTRQGSAFLLFFSLF